MTKTAVDPNNVPPGSLITFIQKGLQYLELEANLDQDGGVEGEFKMLAPEELISCDIDELRQLVSERKDKDKDRKGSDKKKDKDSKGKEKDHGRVDRNGVLAMEEDLEVSPSSVVTLTGHESEVYICAWSPTEPLLASG